MPPKKEEPPPKKEEQPPQKPEPLPQPDERLQPILPALKARKSEERLRAVEELGRLGEAARPAARNLCDVLVSDPSQAVRQAALAALEKIHPELHKPLVVLLVEADAQKNRDAARDLGRIGRDGRAALPVLLAHVRNAPAKFQDLAPSVIAADAEALAQVAPDDAATHKALLDLTKFTLRNRSRDEIGRPARAAAVQALGEIVRSHPDQAKDIAPGLAAAAKAMADGEVRAQAVSLLGAVAEAHPNLRAQIAPALLGLVRQGEHAAIVQLGKCGREARDAVPVLKQLKLHPLAAVREAATDALARVEESVADVGAPRKEEAPRTEAPPRPAPRAEDPDLPARLRPAVARLKGGTTEEKIKAAEELAGLGEDAKPAARALCEAALDPSQRVARAALLALEKVQPDLHRPVFVFLVDEAAANHLKEIGKLALLGDQGKPAVPVVFHQIKRCQEQLEESVSKGGGRWGSQTLVQVITAHMQTLTKIASDDPQVVKTLIDLTKYSNRFLPTPFRPQGVELLGGLGESQPAYRKQIVPVLVAVLKEAVEHTKSDTDRDVLESITEVERTGEALLKCGTEAQQSLKTAVVPRLKDLEFHRSDLVRKKAEALRSKITDAP